MNILLIAPKFFDYEKEIINELSKYYTKVIFKTEVPFQSNYKFYAVKRISQALANFYLKKYNKKLLAVIKKENINRIFIIRGIGLNEEFLKNIKTISPNIKIFHYQWDSLSIFTNGKKISKFCDYNFSFDNKDCNQNKQFRYLPLFRILDKPTENNVPLKYDFCFIGTYHSNRNILHENLLHFCNENGFKYYNHLYMPFFTFIRKKLISKEDIKIKNISFKKINHLKYLKLLTLSKIIIDSPYENQCGATMRTIESLSINKKIISTNHCLKNEDFYLADNILLVNDYNINYNEITNFIKLKFNLEKQNYILNLNQWLKQIGLI